MPLRSGQESRSDPTLLARPQHTELVAVRIGHHDPADVALTDVDAPCPEGDQAVDLLLLVGVGRWGEVEVQSVLAGLGPERRTAPRDLGAALGRLDRGLLVLVPHQRPAECLAPEVAHLLRAVARESAEKPAAGEEAVAGRDDAELVALRVGEDDVVRVGALPDVEVPSPQLE